MTTRQINLKIDSETRDIYIDKCKSKFISHIDLLLGFINYISKCNDEEFDDIIKLLREK